MAAWPSPSLTTGMRCPLPHPLARVLVPLARPCCLQTCARTCNRARTPARLVCVLARRLRSARSSP
eukprot:3036647-Pleurochrysis_carterae.AAC.1